MDGLSLVSRLAAAVPPPRQHGITYAGVLAAAAAWRPEVIPPLAPPTPPPKGPAGATEPAATATDLPPPKSPRHRCRYRSWAELQKLTFGSDLLCPQCGSVMRLRALVRDAAGIDRYLRYLDEPTELPPRAAARAPPWRCKVTRVKSGDEPPPDEMTADLFEN